MNHSLGEMSQSPSATVVVESSSSGSSDDDRGPCLESCYCFPWLFINYSAGLHVHIDYSCDRIQSAKY